MNLTLYTTQSELTNFLLSDEQTEIVTRYHHNSEFIIPISIDTKNYFFYKAVTDSGCDIIITKNERLTGTPPCCQSVLT